MNLQPAVHLNAGICMAIYRTISERNGGKDEIGTRDHAEIVTFTTLDCQPACASLFSMCSEEHSVSGAFLPRGAVCDI